MSTNATIRLGIARLGVRIRVRVSLVRRVTCIGVVYICIDIYCQFHKLA